MAYYQRVEAHDNSQLHLGDVHYHGGQDPLKHVPGALFDAYGLNHRPCHPETRTELLKQIETWANESAGKNVFWLNGMAGTGKSTIAYTIAGRLNQQTAPGRATLGASFFFNRGERDRASAALLIPTIARQLRHNIPLLAEHINQVVKADPDICIKALGEQFNKLLKGPLSKVSGSSLSTPYIIVIDALDECQREDDVRTILQLLSILSDNSGQYIRWFLTSRPELPIQLGFLRLPFDVRQNVVLHELPKTTVEGDIAAFFNDQFRQIRDDRNLMPFSESPLPDDWPGAMALKKLTRLATPLFIIADTICRFVQDHDFDPQEQLDIILESQTTGHISHVGHTYLPIMEQFVSSTVAPSTQQQKTEDFRLIVGSIVVAAEPLSCLDLSALTYLSPKTINLRLRTLHSVLQIPQQVEAPIRLLHLSFGEFLSGAEIRDKPFFIDRAIAHTELLKRCLDLLSLPSPIGLHENMCQLRYPGQPREAVPSTSIDARFPNAMQYACQYWVFHARQSRLVMHDGHQINHFLREHFLHWLEALSLLNCLSDAVGYIDMLLLLPQVCDSGKAA